MRTLNAMLTVLVAGLLVMNAPSWGSADTIDDQILETRVHLDELLRKYPDNHPDVIAARARLAELEAAADQSRPPPPTSPPESLVHDPKILYTAWTILLVRVVGWSSSRDFATLNAPSTTLLVLKSWEGPFSAGDVLHTPEGAVLCNGRREDCDSYDFHKGKEFVIMSRTWTDGTRMPRLHRNEVWAAAESQALMAALDQAVKADRKSKDPARGSPEKPSGGP
jgi:hypothetical protein